MYEVTPGFDPRTSQFLEAIPVIVPFPRRQKCRRQVAAIVTHAKTKNHRRAASYCRYYCYCCYPCGRRRPGWIRLFRTSCETVKRRRFVVDASKDLFSHWGNKRPVDRPVQWRRCITLHWLFVLYFVILCLELCVALLWRLCAGCYRGEIRIN